jgi:hypothetical protein
MVFFEHVFGESSATRIDNNVRSLRMSAPNSGENINFHSTNANAWWRRNPSAHQKLADVANALLRPLSQANKNQIYSVRLLVRNVRSIVRRTSNGQSYINRQSLHVNFETNPNYGEAFMQIIYYIDTPRYTNGRIASPGNRGQLLVSQGQNTRMFDPKRGHAVYFTPTDTWHEVLPQSNSNQNVNVDRKMIIMMLYKPTARTNTVSRQIRSYRPNFPFGLRGLAGYVGRGNVPISSQNENALSRMLRGVTVKTVAGKRKRTNNNQPATKRRRIT